MFVEHLLMNGYGQFVWPAFIFSFAVCFYLYSKPRSEFKQQEKIFLLEFKKDQRKKIKFIKGEKPTEEILSIN